jgi:hypothetical protein
MQILKGTFYQCHKKKVHAAKKNESYSIIDTFGTMYE